MTEQNEEYLRTCQDENYPPKNAVTVIKYNEKSNTKDQLSEMGDNYSTLNYNN